MMNHRKKEHFNTVKECMKFKEGKCGFLEAFCWFKHSGDVIEEAREDKIKETNEYESVFQKDQEKLKPPLRK